MVVAYIVLGALIVVGRATQSEWAPGLEMHYGYLTTPIPILAWIIVSRFSPWFLAAGLAAVLLIAYGPAFVAGLNWRLTYMWTTARGLRRLLI